MSDMLDNTLNWFNGLPPYFYWLVILTLAAIGLTLIGFWISFATDLPPEIVQLKGSRTREAVGCVLDLWVKGLLFVSLFSPTFLFRRVIDGQFLLLLPAGFIIGFLLLLCVIFVVAWLDRITEPSTSEVDDLSIKTEKQE